jgi:hypothetical protein
MNGSHEQARRRTRSQEMAWRRDRQHNIAETRRRIREIADRLPVDAAAVPALVEAMMEVARFYAMECAYANYEMRTGHAYPPERREAEEAQERADWQVCLTRLEEALRA